MRLAVLGLVTLCCCSSTEGAASAPSGTGGSIADATGGGDGLVFVEVSDEDGAEQPDAATPSEASDAGADTGGSPTCAFSTQGAFPACDDCLNTLCFDTCDACAKDTSDPACVACFTGTTTLDCSANPTTAAFEKCLNTACATPCNMSPEPCDLGLTTNNPSCDTCLLYTCCDVVRQCTSSPACKDCVTGTSTVGCDTDPKLAAFTACSASCQVECAGGPSTICDSSLTTNDLPCDTCLGDTCCQEIKTCVAEPSCMDCLTGASTTGCDSNANLAAINACFTGPCSVECSG